MYLFVKCCVFCLFVKLRLCPGRVGPGIMVISGVIVARAKSTVSVAPPGGGKNTNYRFSRFFVRSVPLFRSLMLTRHTYVKCTFDEEGHIPVSSSERWTDERRSEMKKAHTNSQ